VMSCDRRRRRGAVLPPVIAALAADVDYLTRFLHRESITVDRGIAAAVGSQILHQRRRGNGDQTSNKS
jgi:hypothetical protein